VTFSILYRNQTGSGANPASYPMTTESRMGHEADHSPPSCANVKRG